MSMPYDRAKNEQPTTYIVQNRNNKEEIERLIIQDAVLTTILGGLLSEQTDAARFRRVLDIGSGSGSWVLALAHMYPEMNLTGIDISPRMINHAQKQASEQNVTDRVTFQVMDALRGLQFPPATFDLVNLRFGISFVRTWEWSGLLSEIVRICQPGGVIRVIECEAGGHTSSPALMQLHSMSICALYRSGHLFEQKSTGLIDHLEDLLIRHGCEQVQTRRVDTASRLGEHEIQESIRDLTMVYRTMRPYLEKWGCAPANYDQIYQKALEEMREPGFTAGATLLTAWGTRSKRL